MPTGTIKTIRDDKGFGFLAPEDSSGRKDLFFHRSGVVDNAFDALYEGQRVSYEEEPDPRDPSRHRAVQVQPAEGED